MPKLSVLIPVRNEELHIGIMVRILTSALRVPHEILVIYDSPKDSTLPVLKKMQRTYPHVRGVFNELGKGVTNAIKAGVAVARGKYILIFAADEVGPVVAIDEMLSLMEDGCDFVSCTRYAYGGRRLGGSFIGSLLSRFANGLMHTVGGMALTDATTGIKMFRRKDFSTFNLSAKAGWAFALEMALKAQFMGMRFGEVPIVSVDRLFGGTSSFQIGPWLKEYTKWLVWGMRKIALRRSRRTTVLRSATTI